MSSFNFTVSSTGDNFADPTTLRGAVFAAEQEPAGSTSTIDFALGAGTSTITLTNGAIELFGTAAETISIDGAGPTLPTIDANGTGRVFDCATGDTTIAQLTIKGGVAPANLNGDQYGGGIYNEGGSDLDLQDCTIVGNSAATAGGGIDNEGQLKVDGCTIEDNKAARGGGLANQQSGGQANTGVASLDQFSTISGNTSTADGGGVYNFSSGTFNLTDCTISGNTAAGFGGGLDNTGASQIEDSTINGNSGGGGGGVFIRSTRSTALVECTISGNSAQNGSGLDDDNGIGGGAVSLTGCTIAGNSAGAAGGAALYDFVEPIPLTDTIVAGNLGNLDPDIGGGGSSNVSGSYDLIGTGGSGGIHNGNDGNIVLTSLAELGLAPLADYDLFSGAATMALLPGSLALGAGTPIAGIAADERGAPIGPSVDIGAFQSQGFTIAVTAGDSPQSATTGASFGEPLAVTVTAKAPWEPVAGGTVTFDATPGATGASADLSGTTAIIAADGAASITARANSDVGAYTVSATAAGAAAPVAFDLKNLVVSPGNSGGATGTLAVMVELSISSGSPMYGQPVTLVATVTGAGTPTGTVTFFDGTTSLGTATVDGAGQATLTVADLAVGVNAITAEYSGDTHFASGTSGDASATVAQDGTQVVPMSLPVPGNRRLIDLEAEIGPRYIGAVGPGGTVRFMIKNKVLGTATVTDGVATLMVKAGKVRHKAITVVYSGDVDYAASMAGPAPHKGKVRQARLG
jgi:hypothetical protein